MIRCFPQGLAFVLAGGFMLLANGGCAPMTSESSLSSELSAVVASGKAMAVFDLNLASPDDFAKVEQYFDVVGSGPSRQQVILTRSQMEALRDGTFTFPQGAGLTYNQDRTTDLLSVLEDGIPFGTSPEELGNGVYLSLAAIETFFDQLQTRYPNRVEAHKYGESWEGRPLLAYRITADLNEAKPKAVFLASSHAREISTPEMVVRLANYLLGQQDAWSQWVLQHREIWLIPVHNPDGRMKVENGFPLWKKNTHSQDQPCALDETGKTDGVDLNRNFAWRWRNDSDSVCASDYSGKSPASEPEVDALQKLLSSLFPSNRPQDMSSSANPGLSGIFMNLHAFSEWVMAPWIGETDPAPNEPNQVRIAESVAGLVGYDLVSLPYPAFGDANDWLYGMTGTPSIAMEIGTSFFEPADELQALFERLLPGFRHTIDEAQRPYAPVLDAFQSTLEPKRNRLVLKNISNEEVLVDGFAWNLPQVSLGLKQQGNNPCALQQPFTLPPNTECTLAIEHTDDTPATNVLLISSHNGSGMLEIPVSMPSKKQKKN
ncbi:MAG: hypothetical protein IPJ88_12280 [Myxococcales bacterium]|nr:MAG: hypothetical protein IPJ88_12280 [Myxococcales bacterium]